MSAKGRKRADGEQTRVAEREAYETPIYCTQLLLQQLRRPRGVFTFLEPCLGAGAIDRCIAEWAPHARRTWAEIAAGVDYLDGTRRMADLCVTNPPFSLALDFLDRSLADCRTVIYLLPLNFLGSKGRRAWWNSDHREPSHLMTITPRPRFRNGGSDACEYAWFVWDRGGLVRPGRRIRVL